MNIIKLMLWGTLLIGLSLFTYSLKLPLYTDQAAKEKLDSGMSSNLDNVRYQNIKSKYYQEVDKLKTGKIAYMDLGSGLIISSILILIFLYHKKIKTFTDLKKLTTFSKPVIYISANIFWLLLIPGMIWYYTFRGERGDYPWFSDSIAIPVFYQTITIVIGIIFLNLFILLTSFKSVFPASIFVKQQYQLKKNIIWEIFWGFWILLNVVLLVSFVIGGDHAAIPINLFFTYILLNLRAGQINQQQITLDDNSNQ